MNQWWKPKTTDAGSTAGLGITPATDATLPKGDKAAVNTDVPTNAIGGALNMAAPAQPGDVIAKLALENVPGFKVAMQVSKYSLQGNKLVFNPGGARLNGKAPAHGGAQYMLLEIPPQLRGLRLTSLSLEHSQVLEEKTGKWNGKKQGSEGGETDPTPGMSQVEFHVVGKGWSALGQVPKFAEARRETETLHDLPMAGGPIDAIRVKASNVDPVHIHEVSLNFLPSKPTGFDELMFTPGMSFGDQWNGHKPYVERDRSVTPKVPGTRYPNAVSLGHGHGWAETPESTTKAMEAKGWHQDFDSISIPLPAGKHLRSVEVAIGDTCPDSKVNNDGSYGYKGYAKLDISVETADGKRIPLLKNENVPPQGLLTGSPQTDYVIKAGDKVRVYVHDHAAAVMGVRVGYDN